MRLRTLIVWALGLALIGWAGYTAATAFTFYVSATEMIDQVLREAVQRVKAAPGSSREPIEETVAEVHNALLVRAQRYGVPLDARNLSVSVDGRGLVVKAKLYHAVLTYGREPVFLIPMSAERVALLP